MTDLNKLLPDDREQALNALAADTTTPRMSDPPRDGWRPARGMERAGMPPLDELARAEQAALLSFLPGRCPWGEVAAFEERLADVAQSLRQAMEAVADLSEQLANEPARHADA